METDPYRPPEAMVEAGTQAGTSGFPALFRLAFAGLGWAFALLFLAEFLGAVGGTFQAGLKHGWLRTLISVQTLIALPLAPGSLLLWQSGWAFVKEQWRQGSIWGLTGFCLGVVSNILIWRSMPTFGS
jgi:hypothetical protein